MSEVTLKKPSFEAFLQTQPSTNFLDLEGIKNPIERRKKRNRISSDEHRKRKKRYIALLEKTVYDLSEENLKLKEIVHKYELDLQLTNLEDENWSQYDPDLFSGLDNTFYPK